jgi:hypothetical protein
MAGDEAVGSGLGSRQVSTLSGSRKPLPKREGENAGSKRRSVNSQGNMIVISIVLW